MTVHEDRSEFIRLQRQNVGLEPSNEHAEILRHEARSEPRRYQHHERNARGESSHVRDVTIQTFGLRRRTGFRYHD